jgi:PAS domain S-box-containing protein
MAGITLKNSSISVQNIIDAFPSYLILVDSDHNILGANDAVYRQLKIKRKEIIGRYCPEVIHGLKQPFEGCPLEEAALKNKRIERELWDKKTHRWMISCVYPTKALTPLGKRIFVHTVNDITDKKRSQDQLVISHQLLQSLSKRIESTREEEKTRIARDLHDETSQILASLQAYLQVVNETLPEGPIKARQYLRKAQELTTTIQDEIHKLIHELRPPILEELGLLAGINSLVENYLKLKGLKVRFKISGQSKRLPPDMEIHLFRIIQEAFSNIVRHAQAKLVTIFIKFKKNSITISIKDDGLGFDVKKAMSSDYNSWGIGLLNMKERVELFNGSLLIDSSPGVGTQVSIEVPLGEVGDEGKNQSSVGG